MDEKIEVNDKTVIDLAKIIHKRNQYIQADWEEYTKSDVALAYAIKWNGYRKESDTAREICLKIIKDQPQPIQEKWVEWFKKEYGVEVE